ncbi:UUP1 family membrane protein [Pseudomarimonas salicorniae]|uniref:Inactive transglutaminase family protein n=1 Tax=Pseudomarimonas salicorniae TaxID=2933270 RepID=A0ABT0GD39_9GAMM|nr:UUP1 family membrane protein [Lysobacter sp. CAU 1642]MCK7592448.1 inactive transglutaminase family protein [Lysobacter sp. CAU 1642]
MKKTHLYLLAFLIGTIGLAAVVYKWKVLNFPLQPVAEVEVWTVQARVEYPPRRLPNTVTLQIPYKPPGFALLDERFVANNYSKLEEQRGNNREVQWAIRRARGTQVLYYRATVVRNTENPALGGKPRIGDPPVLEEPYASAAQTVLDQVRDRSADISTFAKELVRRFNVDSPSEEVALLLEDRGTPELRAQLLAELLASRKIPARVIHGFELGDMNTEVDMQPWLQVHNGNDWITINLQNASDGWPENLFLWSSSRSPLLVVDENPRANVTWSVSRNLADAMAIAERRLEVQNENLVRYSLLSLPLQTQQVYQVLLLVPIGAFIMLILRNLIGIKTYGTFMPVLVALAFRDTGVIAGILLFVSVVGSGLLVRFYLERLRLLLVPRLTAVLIVTVLLMALVSVISNRLDIEVGLSIALFPMVIMAMTIERMSVTWEERGGGAAIKEAFGTMLVAALAALVMTWDLLEHLIFVFPELLLVLLAFTLVLGRYSGYRLTELFRFRALAREVGPG